MRDFSDLWLKYELVQPYAYFILKKKISDMLRILLQDWKDMTQSTNTLCILIQSNTNTSVVSMPNFTNLCETDTVYFQSCLHSKSSQKQSRIASSKSLCLGERGPAMLGDE